MKLLLVIPALLLFLSNIPFVYKMDMKEMMAVMKQSGCCKKQAEETRACHAEVAVEKPSCGMAVETELCHGSKEIAAPLPATACGSREELPCGPEDEKCPVQDATCVCIYCFQYAAPDQVAAKLQFGLAGSKNNLAGYLQQHWKDPHLKAPWQPPDVI